MHAHTYLLSCILTQVAVRSQSVRVCEGVAHVCMCVCVCIFVHIICTVKDTLNHMSLNVPQVPLDSSTFYESKVHGNLQVI
jgi:hypothetical protein